MKLSEALEQTYGLHGHPLLVLAKEARDLEDRLETVRQDTLNEVHEVLDREWRMEMGGRDMGRIWSRMSRLISDMKGAK